MRHDADLGGEDAGSDRPQVEFRDPAVAARAAVWEAMCRPSARSAIEAKASPATISTTIIVAVIAITSSVRPSPGLRTSCPKEWPCCQSLRSSCMESGYRHGTQRVQPDRGTNVGGEAMTIRDWMTKRGAAAALIAIIALVTFAVPAWCVASGTWIW